MRGAMHFKKLFYQSFEYLTENIIQTSQESRHGQTQANHDKSVIDGLFFCRPINFGHFDFGFFEKCNDLIHITYSIEHGTFFYSSIKHKKCYMPYVLCFMILSFLKSPRRLFLCSNPTTK